MDLTSREYAILELMMRRRGTLVTRAAICEQIYDEASDVFSNVLWTSTWRRCAGSSARPSIHTRRGHGYIIDA